MLVLSRDDVRRALSMSEAVAAMRSAFACISAERMIAPARAVINMERQRGTTLVMPAFVDDGENQSLAVKIVSLFDDNDKKGLARIQAVVTAFDPETGQPAAIFEGATLTAIRTGAASGAATDQLARKNAQSVAIFGAGVQGRTQLAAMQAVRDIRRVTIVDAVPENAQRMAEELASESLDARAAGAEEALAEADIVCTATVSETPVFDDAWVQPGTHINAIGSYKPHVREIPPETVARAAVYVDQLDAAQEEAGDIIQPVEAGIIGWDHVRAEIGQLALGEATGRENDEQVTFFKSVGHAVQDAFAASAALKAAQREGIGTPIAW